MTDSPPPEAVAPPAVPDRGSALSSAAALITLTRSLQVTVNFVLAVWLAHRLTKAEHATYLHVLALSSVLPVVLCAPAGKIVTYFLPRTSAKARLTRRVAALLVVAGVVVGAAVAFVPSVLAAADDDELLFANAGVAGLILALNFPYAVAEYVMLARGARRTYALLLLAVATLLLLGVGGALVLAPPQTQLTWALRGTLLAFALQAGAALWFLLAPFGDDEPDAALPAGILGFAGPLTLSTLVNLIGQRLDVFLVPALFPSNLYPAVKGYYLRGATEIPILGALAITALGLIAPEIARHHAAGERGEMLHLWRRSGRMVALVVVPVVGMVEAVAHELFPLIYGAAFVRSVPVFQFFALALVVRVFLPQVLLEFTGATKKNLVCALAALGLGLVFSLTAVYVLGMSWVGFAAGLALANFVANWGVGGLVAKRHLRASWGELADWGALGRLALASGVAFGAAAGLRLSGLLEPLPPLVRIALQCALYAVAFLAAALPLRALPRDDLLTLRRIVTRER